MNDDLAAIHSAAREFYGRAVYSHKVHEVERELWSKWVSWMNLGNMSLAGTTTVLAVISASLKDNYSTIATAVSAAASICFLVWQVSFDPVGKEAQQRMAAKEMLWLREQLLLLITSCNMSTASAEVLEKSLQIVTVQLTTAYKFMPSTSSKAYDIADARLKSGKMTLCDEEIDGFLPTGLRMKQP